MLYIAVQVVALANQKLLGLNPVSSLMPAFCLSVHLPNTYTHVMCMNIFDVFTHAIVHVRYSSMHRFMWFLGPYSSWQICMLIYIPCISFFLFLPFLLLNYIVFLNCRKKLMSTEGLYPWDILLVAVEHVSWSPFWGYGGLHYLLIVSLYFVF